MSSEKKEFPLKTLEEIFLMLKNIDERLKVLEKKEFKDNCYRCGLGGHFAKDCFIKANSALEDEYTCYRCGRGGHYLSECYASYHADGHKI